jgi:SAM-dependent methyltransferase
MSTGSEVKAGFERWRVFEKARAANRMHHSEAYDTLLHTLAESFNAPPRILDLGCGDARDMARVLRFLPLESYLGVDNDQDMLNRALENMSFHAASCRFFLGGYEEALAQAPGSYDVIWLGLFLHHLPRDKKQEFFNRAAALLRPGGVVLAHDPVLWENETREDYIRRISEVCKSKWQELTVEEKGMLTRHWTQHGRQESEETLREMAIKAGFSSTETLWNDPEHFYAVLAFWN